MTPGVRALPGSRAPTGGPPAFALASRLQVTAVDKSAPTAMCVLALGGSLAKQWGPRLAAERVLPTLCPLLVAPTLNGQQFAVALKTVRDVVGLVEKGRAGAAGADGGLPAAAGSAAAVAAAGANGTLGGTAAGAPAQADWMAATAVGPGPSASGAAAGRPQSSPTAAAAAATGSSNPLVGLQLQPAAVAGTAARPIGASSGGFGLTGGQVGSRRYMGVPLSSTSPGASPSAAGQQGWAFAAQPPTGVGGGGGGGAMASAPMRPPQPSGGVRPASLASSQQAALLDPFAGLQLGGGGSGGGGGAGGLTWPAAAAPATASTASGSGSTGAAPFDPFSLNAPSAPDRAAAALQWPTVTQQPPQRQHPAQPRPGGSAFPAGESLI